MVSVSQVSFCLRWRLLNIYILSGTDATIASHIQLIVDRGYVIERMEGATKHLVPSTLGIGLVEGYDAMGFDKSLSKPQLRREVTRFLGPPDLIG
jgi:DNA topoisomerase IA